MKKITNILLILFLFFIGLNQAEAKEVLLTCDYYKSVPSMVSSYDSPGISVLCNIYSDYSHQCYMAVNSGKATTNSNKESIQNWGSAVGLTWKAKDYVKKNNKCPGYLVVRADTAVDGYQIHAAQSENDAKALMNWLSKSGFTRFLVPSTESHSEEDISNMKEYIEVATADINGTIASYSLDSCLTTSDCKDILDALKMRINGSYKNAVDKAILSEMFTEEDQVIKDYRSAEQKANDFLENSYAEIEMKEAENETIKKTNCSEYTYDQCLNKSDTAGNMCIRDFTNYTCRKKMTCGEYLTQETCPSESDYGKCKWNSSSNMCEKNDVFVCTDYNDEGNCPLEDEEGNKCKWTETEGCVFSSGTESSTTEKKCVQEDGKYYDANGNEVNIDEFEKSCNVDCGIFGGAFGALLKDALSLIRFAVPIIIIGLSIIDFIKATAAQNEAEVKKAATKLVQRMIVGVIIFLLPTLIEFVLAIADIPYGTCGIK